MAAGSIEEWLTELGLAQYAELFRREQIDLAALQHLRDADLKDLSLPIGPRVKIAAAIRAIDADRASRASTAPQPEAGSAQVAPAERRQLTVMFCDLVGSTHLSATLDPEPLRELMRAYQKVCTGVVERYEGHVAQYLGDGLMTYFGWPRAHEDDAERATRAALTLLTAIKSVPAPRPLEVRIGIATGPVVVGETGAGDASVPKLAVGETPNIAARLQGLAGTDEVIVAPSTQRLLGTAFEYEDLGDQVLKGVVEPVRAFRVVSSRQTDGRFEAARGGAPLTALVGREEEIGLLSRRWEHAIRGEGHLVLMCGEAGIGKSRVALALRDRLHAKPHTVLRYQCSPFHTQSALYPVIEHLERAAGFDRSDEPGRKLDRLEAFLRNGGTREQFADTAPLLATLLSLPVDRYPALQYSPQKQKERTLETLIELIARVAQRNPVLMLIEDAHWVDPTTQEFLDALVPRIAQLPVLAIVTHRPEYTPRWSEEPHVTVLTLNRLSRRLGAELTTHVCRGKLLPAAVLEQILARTDGVPLFVEELTKTLLESGFLEERADRFELGVPLPPLAIPSTLHDSLMARLDRLSAAKELAQLAACIGREFSHELIAAVALLPDEALTDALDQLVGSQLIFRHGVAPRARYAFKHALVRDAAYDSLLRSRRASFHRDIAAALEAGFPEVVEASPEVVADHLTRAGQPQVAINYWLRAGLRARSRMAVAEAVQHLTRGLALLNECPEGADRDRTEFQLQRNLAIVYFIRQGYPASVAASAIERAAQLLHASCDDAETHGVYIGLLHSHFHRGQTEHMHAVARAAAEHSSKRGSRVAHLSADLVRGLNEMWSGHWRAALLSAQRASQTYDDELCRTLQRETGFDPRTSVCFLEAYSSWLLGFETRARAAAAFLLKISSDAGDPYEKAMALNYVGADLHSWMCDFEASRSYAEQAIRIAEENDGFGHLESMARFELAIAEARLGIVESGIAAASDALAELIALGATSFVPRLTASLAELHGLSGNPEEGLRVLAQSPDRKVRGGRPTRFPEILRIEGVLLAAVGETNEAEQCLHEAMAIARNDESLSFELRAAVDLARFLYAAGRRSEIQGVLRPLVDAVPEARERPDMQAAHELLRAVS